MAESSIRSVIDPALATLVLRGVSCTTLDLFDDETLERFRRVMPVVDMLNKKYGRDTVRLAGANPKGRWKTKAGRRSPRYTTRLSEVPLLQ